jgi:hypothetical protein
MARTGPQLYPGASHAYRYQGAYGGTGMEVNVVVLHTTEGRSLPTYGGGGSAPNLTAVPDFAGRRLRWYQHFDIDISSRALVNLAGGVQTNTLNVCQVELVGTCDPATRTQWVKAGKVQDKDFIYWPEAPDWALAGVAEFLRWMNAQHGVPLTGPSRWPAYPTSYASAAGQRMTFTQWGAFKGVCGHMHVPENTHGDPGAIDFAKLIALAKGGTTPAAPAPTKPAPAPEEDATVPQVLYEPNPTDTALTSGKWTGLAFVGDGVLHIGPRTHSTTVELLFAENTPDDVTIEGHFFLTDLDGTDPSDYLTPTRHGPGAREWHLVGKIPPHRQLRFEVRATSPDGSPVRLVHRIASGLHWAAQ